MLNKKLTLSPKENGILKMLGIKSSRVIDILLYLPYRYDIRKGMTSLSEFTEGANVVFTGQVNGSDFESSEKMSRVFIKFDGAQNAVELIFFGANKNYLRKVYYDGRKINITGKLELNNKTYMRFNKNKNTSNSGYVKAKWQIAHPEILLSSIGGTEIVSEPQYHLSGNITNKYVVTLVSRAFRELAIANLHSIAEWQSKKLIAAKEWPAFVDALKIIHQYEESNKIYKADKISKAFERIIFDEICASQVGLKLIGRNLMSNNGRSLSGDGILRQKVLDALSFKLTNDQSDALKQIYNRQFETKKMLMLLQGDVGSGKTIVALMAILNALECGLQGVMMVPTEILSSQHSEYITKVLGQAELLDEIQIITLTSSSKKRKQKLLDIKGSEQEPKKTIIIGTHALFQDAVQFGQIGIIIIDEQHRFGVAARACMSLKDECADVLLMSATPIPRSLALSKYGYLEQCFLRQKPDKRKDIITSVLSIEQDEAVCKKIHDFLSRDERIYWICPLIEESEKLDLIAIEKRHVMLSNHFSPQIIGVVHGKMKEKDVASVMQEFNDGTIKILLATTIVEVGLDIKNATLMIIEEAQRFGLSQLHQLRGRVGRSDLQSYCILFYRREQLGKIGKTRLKTLENNTDGFEIAEVDLRLRGRGDLSGYAQSGFNEYGIAKNFFEFKNVNESDQIDFIESRLKIGSKFAEYIINNGLDSSEPIKCLMSIFGVTCSEV